MNNDNSSPEFSHKQLRGWVADRLRSDIHEGRIRPGEWLRQERLAQDYNVSQMPVREAFKELASEGLLEHIPYRGVRVVALSVEDVEDIYASRCFLEGKAARAAAQNITPRELQELKQIQAKIRECSSPEQANIYRPLNRQFHILIAEASHRSYLTRAVRQMWEIFPAMLWNVLPITASNYLPERLAPDLEEHEVILRALESRDPQLAESSIVHHIQKSAEELLATLRRQDLD